MVVRSRPPSYTSTNPSKPSSTHSQPSYINSSRSTAGHSNARRFVYQMGSIIRILVLTRYPNFAAYKIRSIRIRVTTIARSPLSLTRLNELHSSTMADSPMAGSSLSQIFSATTLHPHHSMMANGSTAARERCCNGLILILGFFMLGATWYNTDALSSERSGLEREKRQMVLDRKEHGIFLDHAESVRSNWTVEVRERDGERK